MTSQITWMQFLSKDSFFKLDLSIGTTLVERFTGYDLGGENALYCIIFKLI